MTDPSRTHDPDYHHEQLETELRAEAYAEHYAEAFVDDLLDEAGHTRTLRLGDWIGVVRELAHTLYEAGFDPRPSDETTDELAWVFASEAAYHDLVAELSDHRRTHGPPYRVDNIYPVYADPLLPEDTLVMIHQEAIIPAPPAHLERPWFVRHPAGVAVGEVDDT
jgi:hypothetical protein